VLADVVEGDDGDELWVRAVALSLDGALSVRMSALGATTDAIGVGNRLASDMLADGAGQLNPPAADPATSEQSPEVQP
jgi:hydroxymethylbilane synthase